jgi:hypothetical protein
VNRPHRRPAGNESEDDSAQGQPEKCGRLQASNVAALPPAATAIEPAANRTRLFRLRIQTYNGNGIFLGLDLDA